MAPPTTLLGALGDYVYASWHDGRVLLETPAPVTLKKRLALSVLLDTATKQVAVGENEEAMC